MFVDRVCCPDCRVGENLGPIISKARNGCEALKTIKCMLYFIFHIYMTYMTYICHIYVYMSYIFYGTENKPTI